ncbi:MAG: hypothetical protein Q7U79_19100 [Rhodoferax sp.]|nr:hypothetical protein [Rhodoferax sp.]
MVSLAAFFGLRTLKLSFSIKQLPRAVDFWRLHGKMTAGAVGNQVVISRHLVREKMADEIDPP